MTLYLSSPRMERARLRRGVMASIPGSRTRRVRGRPEPKITGRDWGPSAVWWTSCPARRPQRSRWITLRDLVEYCQAAVAEARPKGAHVNQGLATAIIAVVAGVLSVSLIISRVARAKAWIERWRERPGRHAEDVRMLSETVEYRSSLSPAKALEAVEATFATYPAPGARPREVRLTEKTPSCLRYASSNRLTTFLETVVAAAPCGAGSATTLDVVRWLENGEMPTAPEDVRAMREDIEAALRLADPGLQVLVRPHG